jgi:hypothetical protein
MESTQRNDCNQGLEKTRNYLNSIKKLAFTTNIKSTFTKLQLRKLRLSPVPLGRMRRTVAS